jgi:hypothetical protein
VDRVRATREYSDACQAIDQLFDQNRNGSVSAAQFNPLRKIEIEKTLNYVEALFEDGFSEPAGLSSHALETASYYFSPEEIETLLSGLPLLKAWHRKEL